MRRAFLRSAFFAEERVVVEVTGNIEVHWRRSSVSFNAVRGRGDGTYRRTFSDGRLIRFVREKDIRTGAWRNQVSLGRDRSA